jgi:hypothetical protein
MGPLVESVAVGLTSVTTTVVPEFEPARSRPRGRRSCSCRRSGSHPDRLVHAGTALERLPDPADDELISRRR